MTAEETVVDLIKCVGACDFASAYKMLASRFEPFVLSEAFMKAIAHGKLRLISHGGRLVLAAMMEAAM